MAGDLKKAKILVYGEDDSTDAGAREIECLFNPAEYSIQRGADYSSKNSQGEDETRRQYVHGQAGRLSLTLYFDTTGSLAHMNHLVSKETTQPPVTIYTEDIASLLQVDGDLHRPPVIAFVWGNFKFKGVLTSVNQTFTYFGIDGRPLRAKMDLSISSVPPADAGKQTPLFSPDRTKCRPLLPGMSLWSLACEEYGDKEKWRLIAKANGLMNPLDAKPGQLLKLPALTGEE